MIKNPTHIEKNLQCINLLQYPHTLCSFEVLQAHYVKLQTLDSVVGIFYRLSHPATNCNGQNFANLKSSHSWHLDFSSLYRLSSKIWILSIIECDQKLDTLYVYTFHSCLMGCPKDKVVQV